MKQPETLEEKIWAIRRCGGLLTVTYKVSDFIQVTVKGRISRDDERKVYIVSNNAYCRFEFPTKFRGCMTMLPKGFGRYDGILTLAPSRF